MLYVEVAKNCGKNNSIQEIMKEEKKILASFAVTP